MKLLCKLFGHKWVKYHYDFETCERCRATRINRSDLDESENVFHEKWLDKHMD
ncbi:DUF1660 domain-containing protein [Lactococcus lactis]